MKRKLHNLVLAGTLFLAGCSVTSPATLVERNTIISHDQPKITIQVSDEILFRNSARSKIRPSEGPGSSNPVIIEAESHIFNDQASERTLKISFERLAVPGGKWEICLPDFSEFEDTIHTGPVEIDGILFSTGTFLFTSNSEWFVARTYAKILGTPKNTRLQIHYTEKIAPPSQTPFLIEKFHERADKSFTVESPEKNHTDKRQYFTTT